jgi:Holliday junction resolvasome RuvABC DNA-binding subunit
LAKQLSRDSKYLKIVFAGEYLIRENTVSSAGLQDGSAGLVMLIKTPEELEEIRKQKEEERIPQPIPTRSKSLFKSIQQKKEDRKEEVKVEAKEPQPPKEEEKVPAVVTQPYNPPQPDPVNKVDSLIGMGFTKDQAEAALKSTNGNLEQAIEFITSGSLNKLSGGNLTADDIAKIKQLMELGFSEEKAKEAYIECGKDVNAASNKLLGA